MFSYQRLSLDLTHLFQFRFREDFRWETNPLDHLTTVGHLMTILTILQLLLLQVNFPESPMFQAMLLKSVRIAQWKMW